MRYLCVHCGHRFEASGDDPGGSGPGSAAGASAASKESGGGLRCPNCARGTGLERVDGSGARDRPRWLGPALVAGLLLAVAGGYAAWAAFSPDAVGDEVPFRPLRSNELRGHLRRLGVEDRVGALRDLLVAGDGIEGLGESAAGSGPVAKGQAVVAAVRERASAGGFVRWPRSEPRETPILDAAAAFDRIREDGAGFRAYPLEIAAVTVAALRAEGVPAMVAEIAGFPEARAPADPSGKLGYYGVAVFPEGEPDPKATPTVLDPFEGHGESPAPDDVDVLTDLEAVGAAVAHRAVHAAVREGDASRAFELVEAALTLDPRSPSIRSARAAILLVGGGGENARSAFEAAAQLRPDAPRKNDLAALYLAEGDLDRAAREVGAALESRPDYAVARATLAAVHLARGELEAARAELDKAERLDPQLHNLPLYWANYYVAVRDPERAAAKALEAVERRPLEWQRRIQAARVLREVGRYDEMRRQARAALDQVPPAQKERVRQLILDPATLGPTALDEPLDEAMAADDLPLPELDDDLTLGGDSLLLGGGGNGVGVGGGGGASGLGASGGTPGPGLLDGEPSLGGTGAGPTLRLGDPSTLKLREPGTQLRLDGLTGSGAEVED